MMVSQDQQILPLVPKETMNSTTTLTMTMITTMTMIMITIMKKTMTNTIMIMTTIMILATMMTQLVTLTETLALTTMITTLILAEAMTQRTSLPPENAAFVEEVPPDTTGMILGIMIMITRLATMMIRLATSMVTLAPTTMIPTQIHAVDTTQKNSLLPENAASVEEDLLDTMRTASTGGCILPTQKLMVMQ